MTMVVELRDEVVVAELRRRGKYDLLTGGPQTGYHDTYAMGDWRDRYNGDIFLYHTNFEAAKDNGFVWIHLENGIEAERQAMLASARRMVGRDYTVLKGLDPFG